MDAWVWINFLPPEFLVCLLFSRRIGVPGHDLVFKFNSLQRGDRTVIPDPVSPIALICHSPIGVEQKTSFDSKLWGTSYQEFEKTFKIIPAVLPPELPILVEFFESFARSISMRGFLEGEDSLLVTLVTITRKMAWTTTTKTIWSSIFSSM